MGLVLIPDIMGLRPLFDEHCARLAVRTSGRCARSSCSLVARTSRADERMVAAKDNDDAAHPGRRGRRCPATGCDRVGIIGFCMGGMYADKSVRTGRFADRRVLRDDPGPRELAGHGQGEPLDVLAAGDPASELAIVGTIDPFTPPDDVDALEATGVTVVRYEGADHAFVHDPDRPVHRPADAADAWSRAIAWLKS